MLFTSLAFFSRLGGLLVSDVLLVFRCFSSFLGCFDQFLLNELIFLNNF